MKKNILFLLLGSVFFLNSCRTEYELNQDEHFVNKKTISNAIQAKAFYSLAVKSRFFKGNSLKKYNNGQLKIKNIVDIKNEDNLASFYAVNLEEGGFY